MVIILMGTTGAGKTTVGSLLASHLGWTFADADDFHSSANIGKMRSGTPLDNADRQPWLESLRSAVANWLRDGQNAVLACSALKRSYRDELRAGPEVVFVYLQGSFDEIEARIESRRQHFAQSDLLHSQFETLEEPTDDEPVIVVPASQTPEQLVTEIARLLDLEALDPSTRAEPSDQ